MTDLDALDPHYAAARDMFFRYGLESDAIQVAELIHQGHYLGVLFSCRGWTLRCLFAQDALVLRDPEGNIREKIEHGSSIDHSPATLPMVYSTRHAA